MSINQLSESESKFKAYRDVIIQELQYSYSHFKLWQALTNAVNDYSKEMNNAPGFFQMTIEAHQKLALYHLFKVIDAHKDSINITKFLNFIEQNIAIFSKEAYSKRLEGNQFRDERLQDYIPPDNGVIKNYRSRIGELQGVIKNLQAWRDRYYAHIDQQVVIKSIQLNDEYEVKIGEADQLYKVLEDIVNYYSRIFDCGIFVLQIEPAHDWEFVLRAIRFYLEEKYEKSLRSLKNGISQNR